MRVLVTGGAGFIGSNIVKELEDKNAKVSVLDDFSSADFRNLEGFKGELIIGDICDEEVFKKIPKVEIVIHQAAVTDTTFPDDKKMLLVNYEGFKNVLKFCVKKNIKKIVYASSAGVYGKGPVPMKESQKLDPLNTYAYSKFLCDKKASELMKKERSLKIIGLRYFNVYGKGEAHKGKSASMIYQLYLQMRDNKNPRIFKYGEQKRDFVYVKDVVKVTLKALNLNKSVILNVGTGNPRSFNDIIKILNKFLKKDLEPEYFDNPYEKVYQDFTQADTSLLKKTLGFIPHTQLEEGIKEYLILLGEALQ